MSALPPKADIGQNSAMRRLPLKRESVLKKPNLYERIENNAFVFGRRKQGVGTKQQVDRPTSLICMARAIGFQSSLKARECR
jgi:hypothetical protein